MFFPFPIFPFSGKKNLPQINHPSHISAMSHDMRITIDGSLTPSATFAQINQSLSSLQGISFYTNGVVAEMTTNSQLFLQTIMTGIQNLSLQSSPGIREPPVSILPSVLPTFPVPRIHEKLSLNLSSPLVYNHSAVINIAGDFIPDELLLVASLGRKFVPPIKFDRDRVLLDLAKLQSLVDNEDNKKFFTQATSIVNEFVPRTLNSTQKHIQHLFNVSKRFLIDNPNICVTGADKGNISVIYDRFFYDIKMAEHLNDSSIYQKLGVSSHLGLIRKNSALLRKLSDIGFLKYQNVLSIVSRETQFPMIYGVWKPHKQFSIRPIMSSLNVIGDKLFDVVVDILNRMDKDNPYSLLNTSQLISDIKQLKLKPNDRLFSIDVVSMFTHIQPEYALSIILSKLSSSTTLSPILFREIFLFITRMATEFCFNGKVYKQISGLPMGTKGSPVIASIVLTYMFNSILPDHDHVTYLKKYVDDTILITSKNNALSILNSLNKIDPRIKFTMEEENVDHHINFLDVTLIRCPNLTVITKWFCKPYSSNRLVNWYSEHEPHTIHNTSVRYISNMLSYSDISFHNELIEKAKLILFKNSFPPSKIDDFIIKAMEIVAFNIIGENDAENTQFLSTLAPYHLLNIINKCSRDNSSNVKYVNTYLNSNAGSVIFSQLKDPPNIDLLSNVVVRVSCKGCKFFRVCPIITPLILYKALKLSKIFHPFNPIYQHLAQSHHDGFKTRVEHSCGSTREALRHVEQLCKKFKIPVPTNAQCQIDKSLLSRMT